VRTSIELPKPEKRIKQPLFQEKPNCLNWNK